MTITEKERSQGKAGLSGLNICEPTLPAKPIRQIRSMLPLEPIFFVPSLFVTAVVSAVAYVWRGQSETYSRAWRSATAICVLLTALFTWQVISAPLYSQRDRSPDNPGGFSTSLTSVIGVFLAETCLVIPAFPVLIGLALLPPIGWRNNARFVLIAICLLYVGLLSWLIVQKNAAFVADYQRTKQQERRQGDQFQHVRRP